MENWYNNFFSFFVFSRLAYLRGLQEGTLWASTRFIKQKKVGFIAHLQKKENSLLLINPTIVSL